MPARSSNRDVGTAFVIKVLKCRVINKDLTRILALLR